MTEGFARPSVSSAFNSNSCGVVCPVSFSSFLDCKSIARLIWRKATKSALELDMPALIHGFGVNRPEYYKFLPWGKLVPDRPKPGLVANQVGDGKSVEMVQEGVDTAGENMP